MMMLLPRRFFSLTGAGEAGGRAAAPRRLLSAPWSQSPRHEAAWGVDHRASG